MRMLKTLVVIVAFLLLSGPLSTHANIIYNWIGDCDGIITSSPAGGSNGCSGQAAVLVVTTNAYIPGEVFPAFPVPPSPVLLHALYADENVTLTLRPFLT